MSLVNYLDVDNDGKSTFMRCPDCLGVLWRKTEDFNLDSEPTLIIGTEYQCIQCGKKACLLKRNPIFLPPINPML